MKWFEARTVQRGRELATVAAVKQRLCQIRDNPKSAYHRAFMEGNLAVMKAKHKTRGGQYDLVEIVPIEPDGGTERCGECNAMFFSLDDDYLCPQCRSSL